VLEDKAPLKNSQVPSGVQKSKTINAWTKKKEKKKKSHLKSYDVLLGPH